MTVTQMAARMLKELSGSSKRTGGTTRHDPGLIRDVLNDGGCLGRRLPVLYCQSCYVSAYGVVGRAPALMAWIYFSSRV